MNNNYIQDDSIDDGIDENDHYKMGSFVINKAGGFN